MYTCTLYTRSPATAEFLQGIITVYSQGLSQGYRPHITNITTFNNQWLCRDSTIFKDLLKTSVDGFPPVLSLMSDIVWCQGNVQLEQSPLDRQQAHIPHRYTLHTHSTQYTHYICVSDPRWGSQQLSHSVSCLQLWLRGRSYIGSIWLSTFCERLVCWFLLHHNNYHNNYHNNHHNLPNKIFCKAEKGKINQSWFVYDNYKY